MQNHIVSTTTSSKTYLLLATLVTVLFAAASTSRAEQVDTAGWGDEAGAKELSVTRPVAVNAEDVAMLRRLLGVPAPAPQDATAPATAPESGSSVTEEIAPIGDSPMSSDGSVADAGTPAGRKNLW